MTKRSLATHLGATLCLMAAVASVSGAPEAPAQAAGGTILVGELNGLIGPGTTEHVTMALAEAKARGCRLMVFQMDTPGGLVTSTEEIIREILGSTVPVAVLVAPPGAQAASAGLYITNAADIAAMAPGTRIGAGHPVSAGGGSPGGERKEGERDYMGEKIEHDMAAGVRSIATQRGRNAEEYEKMVRTSVSFTEREALEKKVIDLIAADLDELIAALHGRQIRRFDGSLLTLSLEATRTERFEMTARQRVLSWLSNPQVTFILLAIAALGLYVEFNNPGLVAPAVIGGLALILFAMSIQILPVNAVGLLLIALGIALFVLEIKFTSYGLLTIGGIVALTLGFLSLFDTERMPSLQVSLAFILPTSITVGVVMLGLTSLAVRAQRAPVVTGSEGLTGETGETMTELAGAGAAGKVFVHGEYWNATSDQPIPKGSKVRVRAVRNMGLDVEPADRS